MVILIIILVPLIALSFDHQNHSKWHKWCHVCYRCLTLESFFVCDLRVASGYEALDFYGCTWHQLWNWQTAASSVFSTADILFGVWAWSCARHQSRALNCETSSCLAQMRRKWYILVQVMGCLHLNRNILKRVWIKAEFTRPAIYFFLKEHKHQWLINHHRKCTPHQEANTLQR